MSYVLEFQLLALAVHIETDDADVLKQLRYLAQQAQQPHPPESVVTYRVECSDSRYMVVEDGVEVARPETPHRVLDEVYRRVHRRALDEFRERPVVHAGLAVVRGTRLLLVGASGTGKSSLMTRLLYEGDQVEGDELVVVTEDGVMAFPRRFHLKRDAAAVLSELVEVLPGVPHIEGRNGDVVWGLDPTELGFDWRIGEGPVDVIVALEPNHGGRTRLVGCPRYEMVHTVMANSYRPTGPDGAWIGAIASLVDGTRCYRLVAGAIGPAIVAVRQACGASEENLRG